MIRFMLRNTIVIARSIAACVVTPAQDVRGPSLNVCSQYISVKLERNMESGNESFVITILIFLPPLQLFAFYYQSVLAFSARMISYNRINGRNKM